MNTHTYVGRLPETTGAGRPLSVGDTFKPDLAHHHDRWLVESGRAIETAKPKRTKRAAKPAATSNTGDDR
jgi:hypothetical protein